MDALSSVLATVRLTGLIFLRADLRGRYGISMPPPTISHPSIQPASAEHRLVMFHIVREGSGFVEVEGFSPQPLAQGDLIVVLDDLFHSLVDQPGRATIPSAKLVPRFSDVAAPPAVEVGDSGDGSMRVVCGMLQFVARGFTPLLSALPPYLHIPCNSGPSSDWLQANISHVIREAEVGGPGSQTLLCGLTQLLFVETLRCHIARLPPEQTGWLAALNDLTVGRALQLVHADPAHDWTVGELAARAGASRSAFSARFSELLDTPPMTYLTRWRIRLATDFLEDPDATLSDISARVGYGSESAFSRAFKREMGVPPAAWRGRKFGAPAER